MKRDLSTAADALEQLQEMNDILCTVRNKCKDLKEPQPELAVLLERIILSTLEAGHWVRDAKDILIQKG